MNEKYEYFDHNYPITLNRKLERRNRKGREK